MRRTITDVMVQFDMLLPHNNNNEQYFHQSHLSTFFYDDEQTIKLAPTKEGASKKNGNTKHKLDTRARENHNDNNNDENVSIK